MEWVGIDEACKRTGAEKGTLRKRAQRGSPGTRKNEGRWEFELPVQDEVDVVRDTRSEDMSIVTVYKLALNIQRDHIEDLQLQLDRKDEQIKSLLTRVPELEAPSEARRPWWRRW